MVSKLRQLVKWQLTEAQHLKDKGMSLGCAEEQLWVKKQTDILKKKKNWTLVFWGFF